MELFTSYTGGDFLAFYIVMLITCVIAGIWIPAVMRPDGKDRGTKELEDVAMLAGGPDRYTDAVTTDLVAQGALQPDAKGKKLNAVSQSADTGEAGRALLAKVGEFRLGEAKKTLASYAKQTDQRLTRRGLLMSGGQRTQLRLLSVAPYIALFVIGFYRQQAGAALGEPTGFLIALLAVTAVFAVIRFIKYNPRTRAGNDFLRRLQKDSKRMRSAPVSNEAGFAVGLFGTAVLVGTPYEGLHAMRQATGGGDAGSGGDGDSDGGGGGCGGGCGGCGG